MKIAYDSRIHRLDLKDFSFDCRNGAMVMDLEGIKDGNIINNFVKDISDMEIMFLGNYPGSFKCSGEK